MMCSPKMFLAILMVFCVVCRTFADIKRSKKYFLVALKDGGVEDAIRLAQENHFRFLKPVTGFPNIFVFEANHAFLGTEKRSKVTDKNLEADERVLWASQQQPLIRDKRDLYNWPLDEVKLNFINQVWYQPLFNDELWSEQWYMQNLYNSTGRKKLDLNVLPVYAKGITGKGVRVAVLDDGLEYNHDDLIQNFDPEISWDCNNDSPDPRPNYNSLSNRHGTRCAGEIAMVANNKKCGVGISFNARIGGIKLLGDEVYDLVEGMALGFAHRKVDIYSSSWGPSDDGAHLEAPGVFARFSLKRGITEGRDGKGAIYVWASGNGGNKEDNCNCDGYAASIYTITVGSVTQHGDLPWYSEKCSSILTVTYSSGTSKDQMIATTDLKNSCTVEHTGTSASAPLAAGIIALGLEANPNLGWRDVQHIIVRSANFSPLKNNVGWQINGAGFPYNIRFGFGLMNADAFVTMATDWQNVPEQLIQRIRGHIPPQEFPNYAKIIFYNKNSQIRYLEHVELTVNIETKIRGNLEVYLTSPSKTRIAMLERRPRDKSQDGFKNWTFMAVSFWLENPWGKWVMEVRDAVATNNLLVVGNCSLTLYGTN